MIDHLSLIVPDTPYLIFDIFIQAGFWICHLLTNVEDIVVLWVEVGIEARQVEEAGVPEELLPLFVEFAEFAHLLVQVQ